MDNSLTWQHLPPWLLRPLLLQAISLSEAAHLWDEWLLAGSPDRWVVVNPLLQPAVGRIQFLDWATEPTQH